VNVFYSVPSHFVKKIAFIQTGLTGSTGYILLSNPVNPVNPVKCRGRDRYGLEEKI
jgi:hypothetical protein